MTITVKNMYDPTADVAAAVAEQKALDAVAAVRSAATASMFANDDRNQFRLVVDGLPVPEVKSATLLLSIDAAADGFTAVVPVFDELELFRKSLSPPNNPWAEVYLGGKKRFSGRLYGRKGKFATAARYRTLVGWSPVVDALDSAVVPPYETNNMTLMALATMRLAPFGLVPTWQAGVDLPFKRVKAQRDETNGEQLFKLAKQRSVFIMSDENGGVVFHQPAAGLPVAEFVEGTPPFDNAEIEWDGRKCFGQYVCFTTAPRGNKQATAVDDRFRICRRTVISAPEGSDADMKTAAEWAARKASADGLQFSQPVPSWYTSALPIADIWLPNNIVRVKSPTNFLDNGFDFMISSVEFTFDGAQGSRVTLNFVSPTSYLNLAAQKTNLMSWKARMMLSKAIATPFEKMLMDEAE